MRALKVFSLLLLCCFSAKFWAYNHLFFNQIFAYYYYVEVAPEDVKKLKAKDFNCFTNSYGSSRDYINKDYGGNARNTPHLEYRANAKTYTTRTRSHLAYRYPCNHKFQDENHSVYYSPFNAEVAIIEKDWPAREYWDNFNYSLKILLILYLILATPFLISRFWKKLKRTKQKQ